MVFDHYEKFKITVEILPNRPKVNELEWKLASHMAQSHAYRRTTKPKF